MQRSWFFLILLLTCQLISASQQDYPFKLKARAESGKQLIQAQNNGPAPIWATVHLHDPVNATIDRPSPIAVLVSPGETITLATVTGTVPGQQFRIATNYKFSIGTPDVVQSPDASYLLPFQNGQQVTVGQVVGGKITTHNSPASKYAVDFTVPTGTPIVAARKGKVVDIDQNYTEGGADPLLKANHVLILHEDGTLGLYSHLAQSRIPLTFGQPVEAGELLGYSGNTGYSTGPHLHFVVLANTRSSDGTAQYVSQPVKFVNAAPMQELKLCQGDKLLIKHNSISSAETVAKSQINSPRICPN